MDPSKRKNILFVIAFFVIIAAIVITYLMWPTKESAKKKGTSEFQFEINDDIDNHKAAKALSKLEKMPIKKKAKAGSKNKPKHKDGNISKVEFTNTENIGILAKVANMFKKDTETMDEYKKIKRRYKLNLDDKYENLLTELISHIKLRKLGGKLSLREYNDYLYTLEPFKSNKLRLEKISNVEAKSAEEVKLITKLLSNPDLAENLIGILSYI